MTAIHHAAHPVPPAPALRQLRSLVRGDAALSALSGLVLLAAAGPLSDLADVGTSGPARVIGAIFLVLGVDLAWLGAASDTAIRRWVPISAAGDVAWALASFAVAVVVDLSGPGRALIALQGLLVLAIGEAKIVLHRRAGTEA